MNNPNDMPIDVQAELDWLKQYKQESGLSLAHLGRASSIPGPTISMLIGGTYKGNLKEQAKRVFQFRQLVESREERRRTELPTPSHVDTPSSRRIQTLLEIAHGQRDSGGRITVGAMGPGTGKTVTARHYAASVSNVWLVTMRPSAESPSAMMTLVLNTMKLDVRTNGWAQVKSAAIIDHVRHTGGLIIFDEANDLTLKSLEEIRRWHDETQVGVALLGNEELINRIEGAQPRHAYARLASRIANYHVQDMPIEADITAYLDAIDLIEPDMRRPLLQVGLSPRHGGLREVRQILESANMLAIGGDEVLSAEHIQMAIASRATSILRRAA